MVRHVARLLRASLVLLVALPAAGCGRDAPPPPPPPPTAGSAPVVQPPTLEGVFHRLLELGMGKYAAEVFELVKTLVPTRAELRQVVRSGPEGEAWVAAYEGPVVETLKVDEASRQMLGSAKQTEILVHAATTEELAAFERESLAWREFPGGMRDFAQRAAAAGRTWYVVEAREPGKTDGTRMSCFTRVGERFVAVVKPWRALRKATEAGDAPK